MEISINNVREARNELKHNLYKGATYLCRKYLETYDLSKNLEEVVREGRSLLRFTDVMHEENASTELKNIWLKEAFDYLLAKVRVSNSPLTESSRRQFVHLRKNWTDTPVVELYLADEV